MRRYIGLGLANVWGRSVLSLPNTAQCCSTFILKYPPTVALARKYTSFMSFARHLAVLFLLQLQLLVLVFLTEYLL